MQPIGHISPQEFAAAWPSSNVSSTPLAPAMLIDVREPWEFEIAHLDGATLLPLGQIYEWAQTLDKDANYVVMCHHGSRSAMACQVLQSLSFTHVTNLEGGIDAWSYAVDPKVSRY